MPSLSFQEAQPALTVSPNRADIACFVGHVGRRATALPEGLKRWLQANGWRARSSAVSDADPLLHTPVPLESFEAFNHLFSWERRPPAAGGFAHATWLGAAVRSFFRQGGARCLVVRVGDPWPYLVPPSNPSPDEKKARTDAMRARLESLLPGLAANAAPTSASVADWKGLSVIQGLEEAAFVALPDLPELVADAGTEPAGLNAPPAGPEVFVECSPQVPLPADEIRQISSAPACTEAAVGEWFRAVRYAVSLVRRWRRDMHLLAAVPQAAAGERKDLLAWLSPKPAGKSTGLAVSLDEPGGIGSAFLQLAHPWVTTPGSEALPGGSEPPDGVLAGIAARSVAHRGAYHSLGNQPLRSVYAFLPELSARDFEDQPAPGGPQPLIQRVTLLGPSPTGPRMLSDVTTSLDAAHRPAAVGRLTAAILRAARRLGDTLIFEPSGPQLWRRVQDRLDGLMADFFAVGALAGADRAEAYSVRCDETTTSQNDLDNGRVAVEVRFAPAHPIRQIIIVLALRDGGVELRAGAA